MTLGLEPAATQRYDRIRRQHFPAARNVLRAHITLFHALPGPDVAAIAADLGRTARRPAFDVAVTGVRFLGRGVAYALAANELAALHGELAAAWGPVLTPQDRQPLRAHVTVANKLDPVAARELYERLAAAFVPETVRAEGLELWRYLGGPWEPVTRCPFEP